MARKISDEELNINVKVHADESRAQMDAISKANKDMAAENKKLLEQKKALEKAGQKESQVYKDLTANIEKNNRTIESNKQEHKQLAQGIDLTQKSMTELRRNARFLQRQLDQEIEGTKEYKRLQEELGATKQRMYEMRKENFEVQKSMGSADDQLTQLTGSFSDLWAAMMSGNPAQIQAALVAIRGGIMGITKASLGFLATPLGAGLAILVGIGLAVKQWASYNQELLEYKSIVEGITGVEGRLNTQMVIRGRALEKIYGADFQESITTADALVKQFEISHEEAFDTIEDGLLRGGRKNNEYFDSLTEYATFFSQAGFSVEEFKNIINKGYDLKMYSDKLPDAIKEGMLSIQEQTPATRESLINAFGAPFTDDLLSRVDKGKITYAEALKELAAQSTKTQLSVQQEAQLTADVFRGAGEDAGGYAKVMEAVAAANSDAEKSLTTLQSEMQRLSTSTKELEKVKADALETESYQIFANDLQITWDNIQRGFYKVVGGITDGYYWLVEGAEKFVVGTTAVVKELPTIIKSQFTKIYGYATDLMGVFGSASDVIKNALTFNFDEAGKSYDKFKALSGNLFNDLKDDGIDAAGQIAKAYLKATDAVEEKFEAQRKSAATMLEQEQQAIELQKLTVGGLDAQIAKLRALQAQTSTKEEYLKLEKEIAALEGQKTAITGETKGGSKKEGNQLTPEDQAKIDSRKKLAQMLDEFDEQQAIRDQIKGLEKEEAAKLKAELELENKYIKLEEDAFGEKELLARLEEQKQIELQNVKDKYNEIELEKERNRVEQLKRLDENLKSELIAAELDLNSAKASAFNAGLDLLKNFVGENSALYKGLFLLQQGAALADVYIKTAAANAAITAGTTAAVSQAMALSPLTFGQPWAGAAIAAGVKNKLANNINAGIQIATIAGQTIAGFEDGYYPWSQTVTRDDGKKFGATYGGRTKTGVVSRPTVFSDYLTGEGHRKELIVDSRTFNRLDPSVISHIQRVSNGMPGFEKGMQSANVPRFRESDTTATTQQADRAEQRDMMMIEMMMELKELIANPPPSPIHFGYPDVKRLNEMNDDITNSRKNG